MIFGLVPQHNLYAPHALPVLDLLDFTDCCNTQVQEYKFFLDLGPALVPARLAYILLYLQTQIHKRLRRRPLVRKRGHAPNQVVLAFVIGKYLPPTFRAIRFDKLYNIYLNSGLLSGRTGDSVRFAGLARLLNFTTLMKSGKKL